MFIDTHTKDSMENSVCNLISITAEELYQEFNRIDNAAGNDYEIWEDEIEIFIGNHIPEKLPDEILLFHLARRLEGTEDDVYGRNLLNLLTTENAFSSVFKKYNVEFFEESGHIETVYNGNSVDWDKCWDGNSS